MTIYYKDKTLPNRFKECRIARNLTQAELRKLLGFTGNKYTVYMYCGTQIRDCLISRR